MTDFQPTLGPGTLLAIAAGAVAVILIAIIVLKVHAFVTLVAVSALTALAAGIPLRGIVPTMADGFGSTLASVALLVGLGAMLGRIVERSGGAQALADALIRIFGQDRAPFALGVASLIMGFPIFFDAGLVVMLPIVFAVARRLGGSVLSYGIPAAGAFSVMHVFVPPHPGPVTATGFYGADVGWVLLVGLIVALPTWVLTGYLFGKWCGRRFPIGLPELSATPAGSAKAGTVLGLLAIPMALIFLNTGLNTALKSGWLADATWIHALRFLGETPIALLITTLLAAVVLGGTERIMDEALGPICSVVLITGAGGMFGGVLRTSGIGKALASTMSGLGVPVILGCFLVAAVLRVAQGSATVALTTTAALMSQAVVGFNPIQLAALVVATAAGSVFCSHVNDSGFWLVGRLMGMDVATTLRTWTVNQVLIGAFGFLGALAVFAVAGLA